MTSSVVDESSAKLLGLKNGTLAPQDNATSPLPSDANASTAGDANASE